MEIFYTLIYALFVGFYNLSKKFATKKSSDVTILVMYTSVAFLLSLIWIPFGVGVELKYVGILAIKGFLLALSWFIILKVLRNANLSLVATTKVVSSVITFVLGVIIFKEQAGWTQIVGSILVLLGVFGITIVIKNEKGELSIKNIIFLILSALITTTSNIIDKFTTDNLSTQQVQFWFLLFVCVFSWMFFMIECIRKKDFLIKKDDLKNFWIYLAGLLLFIGDIMLFMAYKVPGSQLITISVLIKLQVVVTVLASIAVFKEKNMVCNVGSYVCLCKK